MVTLPICFLWWHRVANEILKQKRHSENKTRFGNRNAISRKGNTILNEKRAFLYVSTADLKTLIRITLHIWTKDPCRLSVSATVCHLGSASADYIRATLRQ